MELEKEIFPGKNIGNIIEEVYNRQKNQESDIKEEINKLLDMIEGPGDAIVLMPHIKGLVDSRLKNDEVLIKLLGIFQKASQAAQKDSESVENLLSEKDIEQLMKDVVTIGSSVKQLPN